MPPAARITLTLGAAAAIWLAAPGEPAAQARLTCESRDFRYQFCPVSGPIAHARVARQISRTDCVSGQTFGWQQNGVWVNNGCAAEFEVRMAGGGRPWPDPGSGEGSTWQVPNWAVGKWQSVEQPYGQPLWLTIYPTGAVAFLGPWGPGNGYWWGDDIRLYDGQRFDVDRDGFRRRAIEVTLRDGNRLRFRRIR